MVVLLLGLLIGSLGLGFRVRVSPYMALVEGIFEQHIIWTD